MSCRRVVVNFAAVGLDTITIPPYDDVRLSRIVELASGGLEYEVSSAYRNCKLVFDSSPMLQDVITCSFHIFLKGQCRGVERAPDAGQGGKEAGRHHINRKRAVQGKVDGEKVGLG